MVKDGIGDYAMKHWEEKAKGWVFLSHSSEDYENVKIVRDYLEENGFSALMFYLKCLNDKDKKDKIEELLEWEINARNIFVLCDSESARISDWVKWETSLVENDPSKIFETIDIDNLKFRKCSELAKLDNLMVKSTLYFIYNSEDYKQYKLERLYKNLNSLGFKIYKDIPAKTKFGNNPHRKIRQAINETKNKGAVLVFLSKKVLDKKWFWLEKELALKANSLIIPILLDDVNINEFPAFVNLEYIKLNDHSDITIESKITSVINNKEVKNEN